MHTRNQLFDDMARLMSNAMGVAQGARQEFEGAFQLWFDRFLAERNLVSREEFEAVRQMAANARAESDAIKASMADLETRIRELEPTKPD